MADKIEVKVPDIGDFDEVEVIDVLVSEGDEVAAEDGLVTLETDKAAMDVPAPQAGKVISLKVASGDKVSEGTVIAELEAAEAAAETESAEKESDAEGAGKTEKPSGEQETEKSAPAAASYSGDADKHCDLLVLGSGPGGYTAAFRAADLGLKVILVERYPSIGGVCLNVGCIPSKALLHAGKVIDEAAYMADHGVDFGKPKIDRDKLRNWKNQVVGKLTGGLAGLAKKRKVEVVTGAGRFADDHHVMVEKEGKETAIHFDKAVIAVGSQPVKLPFIPHDDPRVMDSTDALELEELPKKMLVVGGGIIGLEMANVYSSLGVEIDVVELTDQLMPGADKDIVKPYQNHVSKRYGRIMTGTKASKFEAHKKGIKVTFEGKDVPGPTYYGRVLVAVGRAPNGGKIDADKAGVQVDERGFIEVDHQMRSNVDHIFAIGDVVGQPMLAHKATHEGKVAAEVAAGEKSYFDARVIPSVAYTDPEVAWVGLTETEAKEQGIAYEVGSFPWAASGRALSLGRDEGLTKLLFDPKSDRILGGAAVGPNAGELIAEMALAIEMGADATDIGLTVHPHPTLSETVAFSAEAFEGTLTDLYVPKKKRR
ncbi:dihydrolipoamide dehydrogenase [Natronospira proteinivora]|uniref:Dihydrolipoyl dehydrogenase n=1 Tax=Natronospira proteinivora TaxID=1807133 RepID=A0ABT1G7E8_9GAMM|nr:dihydrolipoyl dehydrogenase [Natronospira proteinivora]MCP1726248.1 dihydrolipoamide dehydrogenase [Natronospira proteinivora]